MRWAHRTIKQLLTGLVSPTTIAPLKTRHSTEAHYGKGHEGGVSTLRQQPLPVQLLPNSGQLFVPPTNLPSCGPGAKRNAGQSRNWAGPLRFWWAAPSPLHSSSDCSACVGVERGAEGNPWVSDAHRKREEKPAKPAQTGPGWLSCYCCSHLLSGSGGRKSCPQQPPEEVRSPREPGSSQHGPGAGQEQPLTSLPAAGLFWVQSLLPSLRGRS